LQQSTSVHPEYTKTAANQKHTTPKQKQHQQHNNKTKTTPKNTQH